MNLNTDNAGAGKRELICMVCHPGNYYKMSLQIKVNGDFLNHVEDETITDLLKRLGLTSRSGYAIAVNNSVVSKINWNEFKIKVKDSILIINAAQGG